MSKKYKDFDFEKKSEAQIILERDNLIKSVYPENYMGGKHNVGFDAVAELTRAYNEPVVLMDSLTHPGKSGMVVTDLKDAHTGQPISTPIHMGKNTSMGKVNEIASIQGRHNIGNLVDRSNVLYADNQRVHDVLSGNRLQLPNLKESADPIITHSISNTQKNMNSKSKTTAPKGKLILYPAILRKFILFTFSLKFFKLSTLAGGTYSFLKNV